MKPVLALVLALALGGCAAFAALPLATQVTTVGAGVTIVAAVTNLDIAIINEYCKLRDPTAACAKSSTPAKQ